MDFELTDAEVAVREMTRRAAREVVLPGAAARDRDSAFPEGPLMVLARLGLFGVNIPASEGGSEAGPLALALVIKELAWACASTAVSLSVTNMVAEALLRVGTPAQRDAFLKPLCAGRWPSASFCLSEPGAGSDPAALATTATRDGTDYVLTGEKAWVTSVGHSGFYLVMARTAPGSRGLTAFLVPEGTPGLSVGRVEDKLGLKASVTGALLLEDVRVPEAHRLGPEGAGLSIALSSLDGGRVSVAAQALGIGQAALEASATYAKTRHQFDKPLADFQNTQFSLADSATELAAGGLLCQRAARLKAAGRPFTQEAAMAKLYCTEAADRACHRAVQLHGGYGYSREYPVERFLRDVRVTRIYEGTSEIQRVVIVRKLLSRGA